MLANGAPTSRLFSTRSTEWPKRSPSSAAGLFSVFARLNKGGLAPAARVVSAKLRASSGRKVRGWAMGLLLSGFCRIRGNEACSRLVKPGRWDLVLHAVLGLAPGPVRKQAYGEVRGRRARSLLCATKQALTPQPPLPKAGRGGAGWGSGQATMRIR